MAGQISGLDNFQILNMKTTGLYIHIPFCRAKCIYCDFFSTRCKTADWEAFADSIVNEMNERAGELTGVPDTVYMGGGTPSLIPTGEFIRVCDALRRIWGADAGRREFTLEVNPEDVGNDICRVWKDCGVNRVSMGVQSFVDDELRKVGRVHDASRAKDAFYILRSIFDNISIDLMFGLPGQTLDSWRKSVDEALALAPEHISAYSLMFEPHTAISVLRDTGRLTFPREDDSLCMWEYLTETLSSHGYRRYEISNYSLPGFESVHNSSYWKGYPYLGVGPSAHSYDGANIRRSNPLQIKEYIGRFRSLASARHPFFEEECLNTEQLMEEMIMLRLRMREGIDMDEFTRRFGCREARKVWNNARPYAENGMLDLSRSHIALTEKSIMVSDDIILALCL